MNQLIGFTDGDTTASYKYNVSGLRYEKTVDGQRINHVWDGSKQIIADVIDNQFYEADCYIRGTNLVAKYNYRNGDKSEYTYYTQNAHGDVVNLTDKDGKVTKKYTYDAFGVEKNIDENDANAFRYCGEYFDAETATIYLRARYYNPSTGRFISRDSFAGRRSDPLSLNLYTYCRNNPIRYIDPSGHSFKDLAKSISSAVEAVGKKIETFVNSKKVESAVSQVGKAIVTYASAAMSIASGASKGGNGVRIPGTSINRVNSSQTVAKNLPEYDRLDTKETKINATYVYQTLYDKGWSKNAICAVLGNMDEESCGINPGKHQAKNGPGYGIVQWDPASKYLNWAQINDYADDSLEGQVEFLVESMQPGMGEWLPDNPGVPDGYGMSYSDFISSSADVSCLAQVFVYCYERPSVPHMEQRINYAVYWREEYFN